MSAVTPSALRNTLRGDQMAVLETVKGMNLKQQQACMLYLPCSKCTGGREGVTKACHRVRDLVYDRGRGLRFYTTCTASAASNARENAATSQRKRAVTLAAAASNPSLRGLTLLSDPQLHLLAAACLRRPDVAPLFAEGSPDYASSGLRRMRRAGQRLQHP